MRFLTFALTCGTFACGALLTIDKAGLAAPSQHKPLQTASLLLAQNGKSSYVIAVASDAIPAERTAATQLQTYLKAITGAVLPVKNEGLVAEKTPQILVGAGKRVKRLLPNQKWNELGNDGILIKTHGKNLVLAGSRPRGALYAVFQFLEANAGVRWWTPTESTVPRRSSLSIPAQNTVYTPPFAYREHFTKDVEHDAAFATRLRENGHFQPQTQAWGGHYSILGWAHTFDGLLPVAKYFKAHPEWYSDPANGNKPCTAGSPMPGSWQPNLSNEAARQEVTKNALAWIRKNPEAGIISISQNDNQNYCRSEGDLAAIEREGSPMGPLLRFVNAVAADIHKEYPDFLVETLAYQYTRKAPRLERPRSNVIIRLCSIEADFARPLDSDANASFRQDVRDWERIAPHLYIWNYVTNFARVIWPHPNFRPLGADLQFMTRNKVFGVFEQGDAYSNGVGDFVQLRTWLLAKLMWNPQQDQNALIDEFLSGYYGAAAPHLRRYIDLMQDSFAALNKPLSTYNGNFDNLTPAVVGRARAEFAAAEKAVVTSPVLAKRVRRERLALDHVVIALHHQLSDATTHGANSIGLPADMKAFTQDFIDTARANGVHQSSEGGSFEPLANNLMQRYRPVLPLPKELLSAIPNANDPKRVIDIQESDFRYYGQPNLSELVDDPLASNGKAARENGHVPDWALQYDIRANASRLAANRWHVYAVVRVEAKPNAGLDGPAFTVGIYSQTKNTALFSGTQNLRGLEDGKYHLVDLGEALPENGSYLYVAPPQREDITNIYIDRVLLVQNK